MTPIDRRPIVAILVGHYLPGSKAGGPIRSVANLVLALGDEFDLRVIAHDRDLGDTAPYPGVSTDAWTPVGRAQVHYVSPARANRAGIEAALTELRPDLVYCQSYFSPLFSIGPRLLRLRGRLPCPILVAPRGEFSPGALALKSPKKRLFLALSRLLGLDRGVSWHATAPEEAEDIRRTIGPGADILLAPPLPTPDDRPLVPRPKIPGELEAIFVSRISPKKNLLAAIEILAEIPGVRLTIYGPKEDAAYWETCHARAQELNVAICEGGVLAPEEVRPAFERGHVFLFPTLGENYGHVVMEALSAGTPILLSDQTPWRDLRRLGVGWDLSLADRTGFRAAIEELRAMNQSRFDALSERAYALAQARRGDPDTPDANRTLILRALAKRRVIKRSV